MGLADGGCELEEEWEGPFEMGEVPPGVPGHCIEGVGRGHGKSRESHGVNVVVERKDEMQKAEGC